MKKKTKIKFAGLAGLGIFINSLFDFSKPVFARMGSTGGGFSSSSGGSSGGGGFSSSSGGSSFSSSSNYDGSDDVSYLLASLYSNGHIHWAMLGFNTLIAIFLTALIWSILCKYAKPQNRKFTIALLVMIFGLSVLFPMIIGLCAFALLKMENEGDATVPHRNNSGSEINGKTLLTMNLTIAQFKAILKRDNIQLTDEQPENEADLLIAYQRAEYLYGSLIRQYITGNHDTRSLRKYTCESFYEAMVDEIKLKASQQTIDDVVVNKAKILKYGKYRNLQIAKIEAIGSDNETQANANFDSSFKQEKWIDYVIYKNGKIANIVYGEHFHINGQDINHQKGLGGKYEENDLRDDEHDLFK